MPIYLELGLRVVVGLAGISLVIATLSTAIRSFILPRNEAVRLNALIFQLVRVIFDFATKRARTYARRDTIMAHYAPVALVTLPIAWLGLVAAGFTALYWAEGEGSWWQCYRLSTSSMLTLGTIDPRLPITTVLTYAEAALGLLLLTLLLSYLPTIYQAFARRETTVARLELRGGTPPSATTLLQWLGHDGALDNDDSQWGEWEQWFVEIEESHTSLPIISFFRSPQPGRSWVTTGSLILETANLLFSALDVRPTRQVELTFKAGCLALNRVYRFFDVKDRVEPTELRSDVEITAHEEPGRADFIRACQKLREANLPVRADEEAAWRLYRERRARYAHAVEFLARLTMAPEMKAV